MAYFLFVDESGQDGGETPYMVLAGAAVENRQLWGLIQAIQEAELDHFGRRYSGAGRELKGKKILKRKVFRHAAQMPPIKPEERRDLARTCLDDPTHATKEAITALGQAKLAYVPDVLELCAKRAVRVFASVVSREAPKPRSKEHLRKDYSYLFERFFYFLEDVGSRPSGIVVFDELEKSRSHILLQQMDSYFRKTEKGRARAELVIPEPFFVHSDLTTGIQIADLAAYVLAWGRQRHPELGGYARQIRRLGHKSVREVQGDPDFEISSITKPISDLRPASERG
jgi:hypothetical protein